MGLDVTLYDKINKKEINYIGNRAEPFQIMTSLILYWKEQQKNYEFDEKNSKFGELDEYHINGLRCVHPFSHFGKYTLCPELYNIWEELTNLDELYYGQEIETECIKINLD